MYNNGNFSPYYPLYFLWTSAYSDWLQSVRTTDLITVLHFIIAGVGVLGGLRLVGVNAVGSTVGALAYGLSRNFLDTATWLHFGAGYAWIPLFFLSTLAIGKGDRRFFVILLAVSSASLSLHAFPAQTAVHIAFAGPMFAVAGLLSLTSKSDLQSAILRLIGAGVAIMLVNAVILVPLAIPDQDFIRWFGSINPEPQIGGGRLPSEVLFESSVAPSDFGSLLVPNDYQSLVGNVFIGFPIVVLGIVGLQYRTQAGPKAALLLMCVVWTLAIMGDQTPFQRLLEGIPFYNQIRNPPRHVPILLLSTITLGALGINDVLKSVKEKKQLVPTWLLSGLVIFLLILSCRAYIRAYSGPSVYLCLFLAGSGLAVCLLWLKQKVVVATMMAISASYAAQPFTLPLFSDISNNAKPFTEFANGITSAHDGAVLMLGTPPAGDARYAMTALGRGLAVITGYYAPLPYEQFQRYYHHGVEFTHMDLVRGTRYLVTSLFPPAGWVREHAVGHFEQYYNVAAYPPVYGAYYVAGLLDPNDAASTGLNALLAQSTMTITAVDRTDDRTAVLFERPAEHIGLPTISAPKWSGSDVIVSVQAKSPALIALNMFDGPAWRMSVNGEAADKVRVNGLHPGVVVPDGTSEVRFHYGSASLDYMSVLRLLSVVVIVASAIMHYLPARRVEMSV
jgi:hypothetical protein